MLVAVVRPEVAVLSVEVAVERAVDAEAAVEFAVDSRLWLVSRALFCVESTPVSEDSVVVRPIRLDCSPFSPMVSAAFTTDKAVDAEFATEVAVLSAES